MTLTEEQMGTAIRVIMGIKQYNLDISKMPIRWIKDYRKIIKDLKNEV